MSGSTHDVLALVFFASQLLEYHRARPAKGYRIPACVAGAPGDFPILLQASWGKAVIGRGFPARGIAACMREGDGQCAVLGVEELTRAVGADPGNAVARSGAARNDRSGSALVVQRWDGHDIVHRCAPPPVASAAFLGPDDGASLILDGECEGASSGCLRFYHQRTLAQRIIAVHI